MTNKKWTELLIDKNLLQHMGSYWKYLRPDFEAHLSDYLIVFEKYRSTIGIAPTNSSDWKALPFGLFANDSSWAWRRQSLEILEYHLENTKPDTVLEIGAWNGWLTKYLAKKSNVVVAADYFVCPFDGIGNLKDLAENIHAIQCDVETIKTDLQNTVNSGNNAALEKLKNSEKIIERIDKKLRESSKKLNKN